MVLRTPAAAAGFELAVHPTAAFAPSLTRGPAHKPATAWDGTGLCPFTKRLEHGMFLWPSNVEPGGTLMLTSGAARPTTLNFLPDTHIVVLCEADIVSGYEDVWARLRARYGKNVMPRTVNTITGPSRTGDIEQAMELGAHGPRRMHIVVVRE